MKEGLPTDRDRDSLFYSNKRSFYKVYPLVLWNYGVSRQEVISKTREKNINDCRQTLFYLGRFAGLTLKEIATIFNRHHSTVMSGIDMIYNRMAHDKEYTKFLENLVKKML